MSSKRRVSLAVSALLVLAILATDGRAAEPGKLSPTMHDLIDWCSLDATTHTLNMP